MATHFVKSDCKLDIGSEFMKTGNIFKCVDSVHEASVGLGRSRIRLTDVGHVPLDLRVALFFLPETWSQCPALRCERMGV